jgi:hypothetical protein
MEPNHTKLTDTPRSCDASNDAASIPKGRSFIEQLDEPRVRERIGMYVGTPEFSRLGNFLTGYDRAMVDFDIGRSQFDGFREWLHVHLNGSGNIGWKDLICEAFGSGTVATAKFFELWDTFRTEMRIKGLDAILEEHRQYELARYGFLTSARGR